MTFQRLRRRAIYRLQNLEFALRRGLPRPVMRALKSFYRWLPRPPGLPALAPTSGEKGAAYALVCFPIITWEFRFQRPQQLLTRFGQAGHPVFYLRTDFCDGPNAEPLQPLAPNVFGLRLPGPNQLDIYTSALNREQIDAWLDELEALRQSQQLHAVVCLVQLPFWGPLALAARERWGWRVVYDCLDEHTGFDTNGPAMLSQEQPLIAASDLVLTTARVLYEKCAPAARRCLLLPNAADFEQFQRAGQAAVLTDLTGPIIGYFGALADWFDTEFVRQAATVHPEWQIVLIGANAGIDLRGLERLPNIHLLGEQPYKLLPSYLQRFDAAVIPFKVNTLTRATNPVKLYEYLSLGKPVVAADLPELEPHQGLLYPASTAAEFVQQLEHALAERDPARTAARVQLAQRNTWEHRVVALDEHLRRLFGQVSIIVVAGGETGPLRDCLEQVWRVTDWPNYEVIVVDNGLAPEAVDYLRLCQARPRRLKVIFNPERGGDAHRLGLAAMEDGEYVVVLDSAARVGAGWLTSLVRHLEQDADLGLVGARVIEIDGTLPPASQPGAAPSRVTALPTLCLALRSAALAGLPGLNGHADEGFLQTLARAMLARGQWVGLAGNVVVRANPVRPSPARDLSVAAVSPPP